MADSSDEENVPPVQKFVQEISLDEEKFGSKPFIPDHINDNTYDYNDSFLDDEGASQTLEDEDEGGDGEGEEAEEGEEGAGEGYLLF